MDESLSISGHVLVEAFKEGERFYKNEGKNTFTLWGKIAVAQNILEASGGTPVILWGEDISEIALGTSNNSVNVMHTTLSAAIGGWAQETGLVATMSPALYITPDEDDPEIIVKTFWEHTFTVAGSAEDIQEIGLFTDGNILAARRVVPKFPADIGADIKVSWSLRIG